MSSDAHAQRISFCTDAELGYQRSRTLFPPGHGLVLDESYRLAHLPLVAPRHPDVIAEQDGKFYQSGRHPRVASLVLPVAHELLFGSPTYRELDAELRAAPFAKKLAWDLLERRKARLHATLCGQLAVGDPAFTIDAERKAALRRIGPLRIRLAGLFSGNINLGRLYLCVYPETRDGVNAIHLIQRAMQRPPSDLYLVGLHNFVDHLDAREADALGELIARWWARPIVEFTCHHLWTLGASDDLALDSSIDELVPLGP